MRGPSYEDLEDEVAALRQRLHEIASPDTAGRVRALFSMSPQEASLLTFLFERSPARKEAIYGAVFEHANGDGPCIKIVDVIVSRLRRKLALSNVPGAIETQWGSGYSMSAPMRSWLAERIGDETGSLTAKWAQTFSEHPPQSLRAALGVLAGLIPEPETFRNIAERQVALQVAA